ncbi:MAG TPA: tyrosine-type recombinase/integrase [Terriglobia bacterium]|nr:tyrosine-type recombinase/integrase [Terriglobia bacterium]
MGVAYLLGGFVDFPAVDDRVFAQHKFATKIFGCEAVEMAVGRVQSKLREWGYADVMVTASVPRTVCEAILANRSPRLEEFSREVLEELRKKHLAISVNRCLVAVSEVLTDLGIFKEPLAADKVRGVAVHPHILQSVPAEWARICDCWRATSTRGRRTRIGGYYWLLCVGRWLGREHPEAISPAAWTRELAAEYVAVVCCLRIGDWAERLNQVGSSKIGKPIAAGTIHYRIDILGAFFSDLQEWGKIPRRFDPRRCLRTPRSVLMQLGPRPRVVADDIWAKLLWAGLNLTEDDLPRCRFTRRDDGRTSFYPLTMVRALVVVLLFSGLRRDEIRRLRVGCVRWQPSTAEAEQNQGKSAICLLDIPVNKTSPPFTKPVDRVVGEAIAAWEQERPVQPKRLDAKTGESVSFLFLYRGRRIGPEYLNVRLIPTLCRKAGVPPQDVRGNITSHRARSTIASQLFNSKEPMSLFELQEWLGHRTPTATQHYVKITPTRLAKSFSDAGYFERNLRMVEVLIDRQVVMAGAAAREPWKYYDLGHGYCSYEFFDQCPHRMACAKCAFYRPKGSAEAQLLEAKTNLLKMQQMIPLKDEELAAVEEGIAAMERLLTQLADVPTPAGPTPRQLRSSSLVEIRTAPRSNG